MIFYETMSTRISTEMVIVQDLADHHDKEEIEARERRHLS